MVQFVGVSCGRVPVEANVVFSEIDSTCTAGVFEDVCTLTCARGSIQSKVDASNTATCQMNGQWTEVLSCIGELIEPQTIICVHL